MKAVFSKLRNDLNKNTMEVKEILNTDNAILVKDKSYREIMELKESYDTIGVITEIIKQPNDCESLRPEGRSFFCFS
jgi:hypothetical protein